MEEIKCKLSNGNTQHFRIEEGTAFEISMDFADGHSEDYTHTVNDKLIKVLLNCIKSKERVRVWYGDTKTGRSWNEEYDVTGRIGRSTGDIKIPLLIYNSASWGGGALLTDALIRIDLIRTHETLWKVDNFHVEPMKIVYEEGKEYAYRVMAKKDGESGYDFNIANFKNENSAKRWVEFMEGKRYCK